MAGELRIFTLLLKELIAVSLLRRSEALPYKMGFGCGK